MVGPRTEEGTDINDAHIRAAWFNIGNRVIEIWEYLIPATPCKGTARPIEKLGFNKFALEVADLDLEMARLASMGLTSADRPLEIALGREAYASDADGNCLSLLEIEDAYHSIDRLKKLT